MCGRVFVKSSAAELMGAFAFVSAGDGNELHNMPPRYNGAPGQDYPLIVREPDMPGASFMRARWGLIPAWLKDAKGGRRPINAVSETITQKPMFRAAYRVRRALMPIDGFFEWRSTQPPRQPYAIAMKDGRPFALAVIWERWRDPQTVELVKTFAVLTCKANALVGQIHRRMPVIIAPGDYARWLSDEPDPRDLLKPYPAELMTMWPISTRVNSPRKDDAAILDLFPEGESRDER